MGRRLADLFHGRPRLQVGSLLAGPLGWLVILYLGSLGVMLVAAFWSVDALSGEISHTFSTDNFQTLIDDSVYRDVAQRTVLIAALVTLTDALLAFPVAFYMAKVASPRMKGALVVAILMPLWSFYLVKVYAWQTMLSAGGVINWALDPIGLNGPGYGSTAVWLVESYLWLPFMILPIYAGLERIPNSLISASEDLGAPPLHYVQARHPAARLPGRRRRLDLHLLAHPRRLHHAVAGLARHPVHRQRGLQQHRQQPAPGLRLRDRADSGHGRLPVHRAEAGGLRASVAMRLSRRSKGMLGSASASRWPSSTSPWS